jgi:hypothetical protein
MGEKRERDHEEDQDVDRWIILGPCRGGKGWWTGLVWLRIWTGGELL